MYRRDRAYVSHTVSGMRSRDFIQIYNIFTGEDFALLSTSLNFEAGNVSSGDRACAILDIIDDAAFEGAHDFTVTISSSDSFVFTGSSITTATVTILDDGESHSNTHYHHLR